MDIYTLNLPEYQVNEEPDHVRVGAKVDDLLKKAFMGRRIAIRCLGSGEHPGKTSDELVSIIKETGHDRYDPLRKGDRYENNENKKIDIFALLFDVGPASEMFSQLTWPFYHWGRERSGKPVRVDVIIVYDPEKLERVDYTYAGREHEGVKSDGFVFRNAGAKSEALLAIMKIL